MTNTNVNLNSQAYRTEAKPQRTPKCDVCQKRPAIRRAFNAALCCTANVCVECLKGGDLK